MQNILITGCSTGIGYYSAKQLQKEGFNVVCTVRNQQDQIDLEQQGLKVILMSLDDANSIEAGFHKALAYFNNKLDILFNNAGFGVVGAVEDISVDVLRYQFQINVFAVHQLTRLAITSMRSQGKGKIIQHSSVLGLVTLPYRGAYCASKYAIESLSDALRMELSDTPIQVTLIEPGPINTQFRFNALRFYKKHIDAKNSVHKLRYLQQEKRLAATESISTHAEGPDAVFKQVFKAIKAPKMQPRYFVTKQTRLAALSKRIFSTNILDKLLRRNI